MNLAFLNAVERSGGVITPELRAEFGLAPALKSGNPDPSEQTKAADVVEIPSDWLSLKWMKKQAIAKSIDPDFEPDPKNRVPSIEAFIEAEIARRAD